MTAQTTPVPEPLIYTGTVMHRRLKPIAHKLDYRIFSLFLDIDAPGSGSTRVSVQAKDGTALAELLVGNAKFNLPGTKTGGVYLRLPGEARTWLAAGGLNLSGLPGDWLEPSVLHIAGERIKRVEIAGRNDDPVVMKALLHKLLLCRVKPYYLYQCDLIKGSAHLRTSISKGMKIIEGLRGHTTGYAIPQYVVDAPGGGVPRGKRLARCRDRNARCELAGSGRRA